MKASLPAVHFLIYGHSKPFSIKEGNVTRRMCAHCGLRAGEMATPEQQGLGCLADWHLLKLIQGSAALSPPCSFVPFSLWELVGGYGVLCCGGRSGGEGRGHASVLGRSLQFPVLSSGDRTAGLQGGSEWRV